MNLQGLQQNDNVILMVMKWNNHRERSSKNCDNNFIYCKNYIFI